MPACAHKRSSQRSDKLSTCGLCMCFDKIQRKAIHAKDRVHNRACTPLWRMKQDHFATAAESASARNRQRDGVQGYDKRFMRGLCMCFEYVQSKVIHAKKPRPKACIYALMAYKEDLSAQLQNALVCKANGHFSELQQAIEARSSQALRTASKPRDLTNKPRSKPCIDALVAFRTS